MSSKKGEDSIIAGQSPGLIKIKNDFCAAIEFFLKQLKDNGYYKNVFNDSSTLPELMNTFSKDIFNYMHEKLTKINETSSALGENNNKKIKIEIIETVKEEPISNDDDNDNNENESLNDETDVHMSTISDAQNCNPRINETPLTTSSIESQYADYQFEDGMEVEDNQPKDDIKLEQYQLEHDYVGVNYHRESSSNQLAQSSLPSANEKQIIGVTTEIGGNELIDRDSDLNEDNHEEEEFEEEKFIVEDAEKESIDLLPKLSRHSYIKSYNDFVIWKEKNGSTGWTEDVFLLYFKSLIDNYAPNTLETVYSKIKAVMKIKHKIDIGVYSKVLSLLRKYGLNYVVSRSIPFTVDQVDQFLATAPDIPYLTHKVAMIFAVTGVCNKGQLWKLDLQELKTLENKSVHLSLLNTQTRQIRTFIFEEKWGSIVKKYVDLRPKNPVTSRFFLNYQKGLVTIQHIGRHKMARWPGEVAKFLFNEQEIKTKYSFRTIDNMPYLYLTHAVEKTVYVEQPSSTRWKRTDATYSRNSTTILKKLSDPLTSPSLLPNDNVSGIIVDKKPTVVKQTPVPTMPAQFHFNNCVITNLTIQSPK